MTNETIRRMNRHRNFPDGTCPASRHTAMIAENLCRGDMPPMIGEEPKHVGESLAATVAALWQARAQLDRLGYEVKQVGRGIRWVKKSGEATE